MKGTCNIRHPNTEAFKVSSSSIATDKRLHMQVVTSLPVPHGSHNWR
uniref:Uncharacterized protein n=1 Tax=Lepeophtheirus salmonis TaxID=72036 RepID=A0A0K2TJU2_LEPSM